MRRGATSTTRLYEDLRLKGKAQAVEAYPVDVRVHPQMPVMPGNIYGVSKCFVEALASFYAAKEGLSCVVVKIGAFEYPEEHETMSGFGTALMRAAEDAARAAGKTLLVLDTASEAAERLYERSGYTQVGMVPGYALMPDGRPCGTTIVYKPIAKD